MHPDGGRGEGVVRREEESTPVLPIFIGSFGWAGDNVVPFEDITLRWVRDYIRRGILLDGLVLSR